MDIPAVNGGAPASSSSAADKAKLNYDSFLRLLVAEMKNQDPTEPKDTSQYLSQLASFSAVEQGVNTNKKLDSLMTAMQLSQAELPHWAYGQRVGRLSAGHHQIGGDRPNGFNGHSRRRQARRA